MKASKVFVDAGYLKALLRIAPKQDIRYYLCGVFIEATTTHTTMVATDGHRLLVLRKRVENAIEKSIKFILAREIVENIVRFNLKTMTSIELWQEDKNKWSTCLTKMNCSTIQFGVIEAEYPDYRRVIPEKVSGEAGCFNADYLSDFKKIASDIGNLGQPTLLQNGGDRCAVVLFGSNPDCFGIVMPMKVDTQHANWEKPEWCSEPKKKKSTAKKKASMSAGTQP